MNKGGENIYDRVTFMLKFIYQHNHTDSTQNRIIRRCLFTIRLCPPRYNSGLTKTPPAQSTPLFKTATTVDSFERTLPKKETVSFGFDPITAWLVSVGVFTLARNIFINKGKNKLEQKNEIAKQYTEALIQNDIEKYIKQEKPADVLTYLTRLNIKDPVILARHLKLLCDHLEEKVKTSESPKDKEKLVAFIQRAKITKEMMMGGGAYFYNSMFDYEDFKPDDISKAVVLADKMCSPEGIKILAGNLSDPNVYKEFRDNPKSPKVRELFRHIKHKEMFEPVVEKALQNIETKLQQNPTDLEVKKLKISLQYLSTLRVVSTATEALNSLTPEERKELSKDCLDFIGNGVDAFNMWSSLSPEIKKDIFSKNGQRTAQDISNHLCQMLQISPDDKFAQEKVLDAFKILEKANVHQIKDNSVTHWLANLHERDSTEALKNSSSTGQFSKFDVALLIGNLWFDVMDDDAKVVTKARRVFSDIGLKTTQVVTLPTRAGVHYGLAGASAAKGAIIGTVIAGPPGGVVLGALAGAGSYLTTKTIENEGWSYMEKLLKGELFKYPVFDDVENSEYWVQLEPKKENITPQPEDNNPPKKMNPIKEKIMLGIIKFGSLYEEPPTPQETEEFTNLVLEGERSISELANSFSVDDSVVQNWVNKQVFAMAAHEMKKY